MFHSIAYIALLAFIATATHFALKKPIMSCPGMAWPDSGCEA